MTALWLAAIVWAAEPVPEEVADAVAIGDCRTATAGGAPTTEAERLVAGWCATREARHGDAIAVLEAVTDGVYAEYGRLIRAEAMIAAGRAEEVGAVLDGLQLPGSAGRLVTLRRAQALVESQRSLEARDDLRALLPSELGNEARYYLAVGGEDRGDTAAAIATYQRTWIDSVQDPWGARAAARLEALNVPVPDFDTPEGRGVVQQRIDALTKANQHGEALQLTLQLQTEQPTGLSLARQFVSSRSYTDATEVYAQVLGPPDAATGSADNLFDYALTHARTGDYATATTIYRRVITQHPGTKQATYAHYKIGYMAYDEGDDEGAVASLRSHLQLYPQSPYYDEALWFAARASWRLGDVQGATELWNWIIQRRESHDLSAGSVYWLSRAASATGDTEQERSHLQRVLNRYPTTGYAWYAAYRLSKRFPTKPRVERPAWPAAMAEMSSVQRAEALLAVGLHDWARGELEEAIGAAKASGRDAVLAAAHAMIATGGYKQGAKLAAPYCVKPWKEGDPVAQQACYPMPEVSIVQSVASRYPLDPLVPFGVMHAESGLDPTVTSIAGARGLMQLMPAEGERIHTELFAGDTEGRPYHADALYTAAYNAAMGTTELGMKAASLDQLLVGPTTPAYVAAYNGGEEAVRRWLDRYPTRPGFDEFAEDIGYTETRRYVRRVLGFVMRYRWVYGDP